MFEIILKDAIFRRENMRLLLQRVTRASVKVDNRTVGQISRGLLVFCGFGKDDAGEFMPKMAEKCLGLRIFEDDEGKMNLSVADIGGELLVVSQFTLYANCRRGRRPGFDDSMPPEAAKRMYELFKTELAKSGLKVAGGIFAAKMEVSLVNDGPVTIWLDDKELQQPRRSA